MINLPRDTTEHVTSEPPYIIIQYAAAAENAGLPQYEDVLAHASRGIVHGTWHLETPHSCSAGRHA